MEQLFIAALNGQDIAAGHDEHGNAYRDTDRRHNASELFHDEVKNGGDGCQCDSIDDIFLCGIDKDPVVLQQGGHIAVAVAEEHIVDNRHSHDKNRCDGRDSLGGGRGKPVEYVHPDKEGSGGKSRRADNIPQR